MAGNEDPLRELVVFSVGGAHFGLWIDQVLEIVRTPPISRLPLGTAEVAGVTSVRGDVVPILDLGVRLLGSPSTRPGRLILVRHEESASMVGLLVDGIETLLAVGLDQVKDPPPGSDANIRADLIEGVVTTRQTVVTVLRIGPTVAPPVHSNDPR
jgi:purine-binding chemotaxis protein CheW